MTASSPPTGRPERDAPGGPEASTTVTGGTSDASLGVMPAPTISTPLKHGAITSVLPRRAEPEERFYHPELDSIRFFLLCAVLTYHTLPHSETFYSLRHVPAGLASFLATLVRTCASSLEVFYIISAYLITELIVRERELRGSVDLKAFYTRRLLRIWPLYFFFIGVVWLMGSFDKSRTYFFDRGQPLQLAYVLSFLLFAGNWFMVFRKLFIYQMLDHLWSVSFEEQFYLLWPLILRRASRGVVLTVAIGLLPLANFARLMLLRVHVYQPSIWCNTLARLDSIACGILLAVILHRRKLRVGLWRRLVLLASGISAWLLVGRYCGLVDTVPPLFGSMVGYPLMTLGAVAIFLSILGASQDGAPALKSAVFVYLGKISYGLYVFHYLCARLTGHLLRQYAGYGGLRWLAARWICTFAATLVLAVISFHCLEKPFLRLKRRFTYVPSGAAI